MNLSLVDPFVLAQDCPESLSGALRNGHSACVKFSHKGDLLASGRLSGTIVIFDLETRGVARKLRGHTRQIQSLCWSGSDRYLLSASQDWKCLLWDLRSGDKLHTVRFEAPVFVATLNPRNRLQFVVALFEDHPQLVDLAPPVAGADQPPRRTILPSVPVRDSQQQQPAETAAAAAPKVDAKNMTTVTTFSPQGRYIFAGTNKGWLNVISARSGAIVHSHRISSSITILIKFSPTGKGLLVSSSDRIIRSYLLPADVDRIPDPTVPTPAPAPDQAEPAPAPPAAPAPDSAGPSSWAAFRLELEHKFQDLVSRLSWNYVSYSSTGEYVIASTWLNQTIYIWERSLGTLVKILDGPKEEFSVVEWHPHRPVVAAVGVDSGAVYLWAVPTPQQWSALAPDFVEVEENVEYVEREDEFDLRPAEELEQRRLDVEDDQFVDVLALQQHPPGMGGPSLPAQLARRWWRLGDPHGRPFSDDDDDTDTDTDAGDRATLSEPDFQMPVLLGLDCADSEDDTYVPAGTGQFRRKSPVAASVHEAAAAAAPAADETRKRQKK